MTAQSLHLLPQVSFCIQAAQIDQAQIDWLNDTDPYGTEFPEGEYKPWI